MPPQIQKGGEARKLEYRHNAALVLRSDRHGPKEPTGEAVSLSGKFLKMGDRARVSDTTNATGSSLSSASSAVTQRIEKARKKRERPSEAGELDGLKRRSEVIRGYVDDEGDSSLRYIPKTRDMRIVWEQILSICQRLLGDVPHEVLSGASEEVVAILRDGESIESDKRTRVSSLLATGGGLSLNDETFARLSSMSKLLMDFTVPGSASSESAMNEGIDEGVAVFQDDTDDKEGGANDDFDFEINDDEVEDDKDENSNGAEESEMRVVVEKESSESASNRAADLDAAELAAGLIPVRDIDAFFVQRQVAKYTEDANEAMRLAGEILTILSVAISPSQPSDVRLLENQLVSLLDFEKFELIRLIVKNAPRIHHVTRFRQASNDEVRAKVRAEIAADTIHGGPEILRRLGDALSSDSWTQDRTASAKDKVTREAEQIARSSRSEKNNTENELAFLSPSSGAVFKPDRLVDLDALAFTKGAHTMSNAKVVLPEKSWRALKKGYEEVHVPAQKPRPMAEGEREIPITELPGWAQGAFKGMTRLNRVQSRLYETALFSPDNMLLCAPTGAGKTNVAVLAILHELGLHRQEVLGSNGSDASVTLPIDLSAFKIVYVAPMKALVQEVVANFTQRLGESYGIKVRELSGDQNLTKQEIADTQIIVTTPEKWDVVTRKSGERTFTQLVRLLIFDEIHLLHDERGPVIEALVSRTMRQVEASSDLVRIVGLSATLPNYEDVAAFLRVKADRGLFVFDSSFRPAPLQQQYIGVTEKNKIKQLQLMNSICYEKVLEQAGKNQILIFVHSRKDTARTARAIRDMFVENNTQSQLLRQDGASKEILVSEANAAAKDTELKDLLPFGFACHHAGMQRSDRTLVEELFADGHIQVLCSTATLAWGVNLPAHTVIIKGTQIYNPEKGRWVEISPLDIMQMLGRAGRPQYDTFGEGIIITKHDELQFYLSLMNQQLPVESQMIGKLADNLNAEIVLGTIANLKDAGHWLSYSYLYVRMLRAPHLYGVADKIATDPRLYTYRLELAHSAATLLDRHNLIRYDKRTGVFQPTALGRVASHYYITHPTISTYNEILKPSLTDLELFRLFSLSAEFKNVVVRQEEREELRKLLDRVPIPVKETMEEPSAKVNVLLQAYISKLKLDGFALAADMVYVHQSAARLMRAIFEICLRRGWALLARKALDVAKMIDHRQWGSSSPLRQFSQGAGGLSDEVLIRLEKKDIPWERYNDLRPSDLGELVRLPKLGKNIHKLVHMIPRLEVQVNLLPITRSLLRIDLIIEPDFIYDVKAHGGSESFWIFVEDADGDTIIHQEFFSLKMRYATEEHKLTFFVPLTEPTPPQYFIRVVSDRWLHSETLKAVPLRSLLLPAKFPPHTELLDLSPLPLTALGSEDFTRLYLQKSNAAHQQIFNPIQTQTFSSLFETDQNVLISAPSGSGRNICAEFALLRLFKQDPDARAVYIAPHVETTRQRYDEWEVKFGVGLGKAVIELTGELAADLRLLERCNICIATPRQWDALSRRWKKRRAVQEVSLFICDDLDMIGSFGSGDSVSTASLGGGGIAKDAGSGATYEVVVSRMRQMTALLEGTPARLVALSNSVANARDLADWIGAGPTGLFNFLPQTRAVPLEIRIQGFDNPNASLRLSGMARPVYHACALHAEAPTSARSIVFVPSRKQAQLTAIDLLSFAAADNKSNIFLRCETAYIDEALTSFGVSSSSALHHTLHRGVAYLHSGMTDGEQQCIAALFESGAIAVVVAPAAFAWSMGAKTWDATTVVVMGTEAYDGRQRKYVDYPLSDVLYLVGRAVKPLSSDGIARAFVLCASTRKEYLKKFLYEPLPVESQLHRSLHDHLCAEVVNRVVQNKQEALDYLTWSLLYRRLAQNPNYYGLQGTSSRHLTDYLSELLDSTLNDLEGSQCVEVIDELDLAPLNLGMISSYYNCSYITLEVFAASVAAKSKLRGLVEIIANASEFDTVPIRHGEEKVLRQLAMHVPIAPPAVEGKDPDLIFHDAHVKTFLLLQAHFSRHALSQELRNDLARILQEGVILVQALVDVVSSEGWLKPALAAMELSQMLVQGLWADKDSSLLQVPHFTPELVAHCASYGTEDSTMQDSDISPIESVFDLTNMEQGARQKLLQLSDHQLADVARFANRVPSINMSFSISGGGIVDGSVSLGGDTDEAFPVVLGESLSVSVTLEREGGAEGLEEGAGVGAVYAPRFPTAKTEGWWLVIGQPATNTILAIKRITLGRSAQTFTLDFVAPAGDNGSDTAKAQLLFMCDSYSGIDQEQEFHIQLKA
jgi:pre-mRNA-splicing helicase BRR2